MNKETVHSVKEKSMYRNTIQLNTVIKERTNEEGLMNQRKKEKKKKKKEREREGGRSGNIKACMQLRFKKKKKKKRHAIFATKCEYRPDRYMPSLTMSVDGYLKERYAMHYLTPG